MMSSGKCAVCKKQGTIRCDCCETTWYCGQKHRKQNKAKHEKTTCIKVPARKCALCRKQAFLHCAYCQSIWYCSKEHQNSDWQNHKETACMPFKILNTPVLGNFVVASRDIKKGDLIMNEEPLLLAPDHPIEVAICFGCLNLLPLMDNCPRCMWRVCTKHCTGLRDPLYHGAECHFFSVTKPWMISLQTIAPLRILLLQRNDLKKWKLVEEMAASAISRMKHSKSEQSRAIFEQGALVHLAKFS